MTAQEKIEDRKPVAPKVEGKAPEASPMNAAERKANEKLNAIIKQACDATKASHDLVTEAAIACLKHFEDYSDARPMDRLMKGLPDTFDKQPLIFWVRQNSPIFWNSKAEVKVKKEGQEGYVELDVEAAGATAWNQTKEYKERQKAPLEALSVKTFFDRIHNFPKQLKNTMKDDSRREFDASYGDTAFCEAFLNDLSDFITTYEKKAEKIHKQFVDDALKAQRKPSNTLKKGTKATTGEGVAGHA